MNSFMWISPEAVKELNDPLTRPLGTLSRRRERGEEGEGLPHAKGPAAHLINGKIVSADFLTSMV